LSSFAIFLDKVCFIAEVLYGSKIFFYTVNHDFIYLTPLDVKTRWTDTYFPFTHPSWELEVEFNGEFLEVLGCGIMEQKILQNGYYLVGFQNGLGSLPAITATFVTFVKYYCSWCRRENGLGIWSRIRAIGYGNL